MKINVAAIESIVSTMTVAKMREAAKDLGIKNAKKYKRPELSKLVVDVMVSVEEAKTAEELKKCHKSQKGMKKAIRGSNKNIEADVTEVENFLSKCDSNTSHKYIVSILLVYGRTVLIRVMAQHKIKGWYRIYDKQTMVEKITEQVAA